MLGHSEIICENAVRNLARKTKFKFPHLLKPGV